MESHPAASLTERLKNMAPHGARRLSRRMKAVLRTWRNRRLTAQEVFTRIYAERMWGSGLGDFYSGPGSNADAAAPYADFVSGFIADHDIRTVVDLGCGDFRVGLMIASSSVEYTGVDVVQPLIDDDNRRFGSDTIRFQCLDITTDTLPEGDLCLIREVFQHISNAQISAVLANAKKYKYVLITDMHPEEFAGYAVNRDMVHGDCSRIVHTSYLLLEQPPFDLQGVRLVFETSPEFLASYAPFGSGFKLRTFLWQTTPAQRELEAHVR